MEKLPAEVCLKIFKLFDHHTLATSGQVLSLHSLQLEQHATRLLLLMFHIMKSIKWTRIYSVSRDQCILILFHLMTCGWGLFSKPSIVGHQVEEDQDAWRWKALASDNVLWCNLFKERWGADCASFYAPRNSEPWKDVYIVQDRCDRYGLGLKIIREGGSYYLIHQGEIQRYLGCRGDNGNPCGRGVVHSQCGEREQQGTAVSDSILFFLGDMEAACADAKRVKKT